MVGLLGCGCCDNCDCSSNTFDFFTSYSDSFSTINTPPWYQTAIGQPFVSEGGRIVKRTLFYAEDWAWLSFGSWNQAGSPSMKFQNLTLDSQRYPIPLKDPCFKKLSTQIEYECTDPGRPGPSNFGRPYVEYQSYAHLEIRNFDAYDPRHGKFLGFTRLVFVWSRRNTGLSEKQLWVVGGEHNQYGFTTIYFSKMVGLVPNTGILKITCEYQGMTGSQYNPWKFRYWHNDTLYYELTPSFEGAPAPLFRVGSNCGWKPNLYAGFGTSEFIYTRPTLPRSIYFDNYIYERFKEL